MAEWWEFLVALFAGLGTILGVYYKISDRREKYRQQQAEKRNKELQSTIEKANKPHMKRLEQLEDGVISLKDVADRSMTLHEQHNQNFGNLDKRVYVLEKTSNGVRTEVGYKEVYKEGAGS